MRSSDWWTWPALEPETVKTWCGRLLLFAVSLALLALVTGVATGKRFQGNEPATSRAFSNAHSGAGNLVPVW